MDYTLPLTEITYDDRQYVGEKNASLGEVGHHLADAGVRVPAGFALTTAAWDRFLQANKLTDRLDTLLSALDTEQFDNLEATGEQVRNLMAEARLPADLQEAITSAYRRLKAQCPEPLQLAVRSSVAARDLSEASFVGQVESFINIQGTDALMQAIQQCYLSFYSDRAIRYRADHGFAADEVKLAIGVQQIICPEEGSAGVAFSHEPESGFADVVVITGAWGLSTNITQGKVDPDEFLVYKPHLDRDYGGIIRRQRGEKAITTICPVYAGDENTNTKDIETPLARRRQWVLSDTEVGTLARWAVQIEEHFGQPVYLEWVQDEAAGELCLIEARPATGKTTARDSVLRVYRLKEKGEVLTSGAGLGDKITAGRARVLFSPTEADRLEEGDILVTHDPDPDWEPVLKKAAALVTDAGGRTSHAAVISRERGGVAIMGTGNATQAIKDGQEVTVSCAEGKTGRVYAGCLAWEEKTIDPEQFDKTRTQIMLILSDPGSALRYAALPTEGVGLLRMEFIINGSVKVHPQALVDFERVADDEDRRAIEALTAGYEPRTDYFVQRLSEAVATVAAAFHPRPVIVRMSDFKSNEYADLLGGKAFEPAEDNPMLGFRGAARYFHDRYREGFRLECAALQRVREEMGFRNVKLMIPFCRTPEEGRRVIALMAENGLQQGQNDLEIYTMIEVPSNVILAAEFADLFDGFSIGSNDLTQLTLGIDRDNELLAESFREEHPAVKQMISRAVKAAKDAGIPVGLCGQAPSDKPDFARFLVEQGLDSISFNPDAVLGGMEAVSAAEKEVDAGVEKK